MRNSMCAAMFIGAFSLLGCASSPAITGKGGLDSQQIRGFTQFSVYRGADTLGYIPSDGNENFNFRVWEGRIKKDAVKQQIRINYSVAQALELKAKFAGVFSAESNMDKIQEITLVLDNPVEYSLDNPFPSTEYVKRNDFLSKQYVGSVLKVDRIQIELRTKEGMTLSGSSALPALAPQGEAKYKISQSENAVFFAENAFVGYKLFTPPPNAAQLSAFSFEYQFLRKTPKSSNWELLGDKGEIREGDALKIRLRASADCYVYLFNLDSGGNVHVLFPGEKVGYQNPLQGQKQYDFPGAQDQAFIVDDIKGIEEFVFMVMREDKPEVQALIEQVKKGKVKTETFAQSGVVRETRGVAQIKTISARTDGSSAGFDFKTKQIQGLSSDYKDTWVLVHK